MRTEAAVGIEPAARANGRKEQSLRRKAARWVRIIEAQRRSNLTVAEFCRRHRIAKATFWYWRKRLLLTAQPKAVAQPAQKFLAVPIVTPGAEHVEVDLSTMRVRLEGSAAAQVVEAILARVGCRVPQ